MKRLFPLLAILLQPGILPSQQTRGYYRFPAIHGDTIVFSAEGDLWRIGLQGGMARRLTSHPGEESNPAISPDGKTLAFTAEYEGPTEIYTMPLAGGLPTRRTFQGEGATVVGWTPDGRVIYSTRYYSTLPDSQLVTIDLISGKSSVIPLSQASQGTFEPGGKALYFTRLPFQGSHTKRYKGGTAQNLWKYVDGQPEAVPLTADYPGTSKDPMWWKGRIYFASDRDGTMNLWSMREDGHDLRQQTRHRGWDVKSPSLSDGRIVYQLGADLHLYDISSEKDTALEITLASDFDQMREKWVQKPMEYLTTAHISPDGDRLVLTARGQVFVVPSTQGRLVEATRKKGVRYRGAVFMPDGKSLLALSDESGELEFCRIPANGVGDPESLTNDGKVFRLEGAPSPDGKLVAHTDKNQQLWIYDIGGKKQTLVATSLEDNFSDLRWSPDSKWLAYVETAANTFRQIKLHHLADGSITALTGDRIDSYDPAWSLDGNWLYFVSDRNLQSAVPSPWGPRQPEPYFDKTSKIYLVALKKDFRSPFEPPDELHPEETGKKDVDKSKSGQEGTAKPTPQITIDAEGLQARVMEVPVSAGNYGDLLINDKRIFYISAERPTGGKRNLIALDITNKEPKPKTLVEDIRGYELSGDGKKLMVRKGEDFYVIDSSSDAGAKLDEKKVNLKDWTFPLIPREEWRHMFTEAWRLERDYFYDPKLHGVDWPALLQRYRPLADRITTRSELSDLISQLVGELSALHIFVVGGDFRKGQDEIMPASLGAELTRDEPAGGFRITHIYKSEPDFVDQLSPLAKPGLGVREQDVIMAIDGVPTLSVADPAVLLRSKAGKQVLLRTRSGDRTNDVIVNPISPSRLSNLRYNDWEYTRRVRVEELGKGDIGYVHLRAMGGGNFSEWVRNFYPVFDRKGLIVDVRHNNGGNIDSWILEKLLRKAWFFWQPRVGNPSWNMQYAFRGHVVVLCDEHTASDGEAFAEGFRRLGLGKVIGTRTWGGEIWLSFDNWLEDNGIASAAETGVYGPEGKWLIEGHGVDPDVVVDNLPHATFGGRDAQLEEAVSYLQGQIRLHPVAVPPSPPRPDKSLKQ
ncbi:MAG TPA: S41 family peptidase [Acidobacteriota bacterium]|nr:S41 family peptidase [Acidobacteriota bacterium]